jgi:transcriptional regulator with XRE-family HTH domain
MSDNPDPGQVALGSHLRRVRKQKGLSLLDVQALSKDEFKASVLGAYERGERAISATRLQRLSDIYSLPVQALLPPARGEGEGAGSVAIDIAKLEQVTSPEGKTVARFVRHLQSRRQEPAARVIRIRRDDVVALAAALDRGPAELVKLLEEQGLRAF